MLVSVSSYLSSSRGISLGLRSANIQVMHAKSEEVIRSGVGRRVDYCEAKRRYLYLLGYILNAMYPRVFWGQISELRLW
eukprot:scaffold10748_cov131-Skeletonema_menzelii.AAC.1